MTKKQIAAAALLAACSITSVVQFITVTKTERAKRRQIQIDADKDLAAIKLAHSQVRDDLKDPEKPIKPLQSYLIDAEFRTIMIRSEMD